jgi:hypothetical protein
MEAWVLADGSRCVPALTIKTSNTHKHSFTHNNISLFLQLTLHTLFFALNCFGYAFPVDRLCSDVQPIIHIFIVQTPHKQHTLSTSW